MDGLYPPTFVITDAVYEIGLTRRRLHQLAHGDDSIEVSPDCVVLPEGVVLARSKLVFCPACAVPHVVAGMAPGPVRVAGHKLSVSGGQASADGCS